MAQEAQATVIVPTYARPEALGRCMAAVRRQTVALEVLVVHDGHRRAAEMDAICRAAGARLIRVSQGGVAAARNVGVRNASNDLLLLLDDDCEPAPDWAEWLIAELQAGAPVVAGRVVNALRRDVYGAATQAVHDHLMEEPADTPFATPNNVGCRREVLEAVPFDPGYLRAAEDRDWCHRVATRGFVIRRLRGALVLHRQELTLFSFLRKHVSYGQGSARFRARSGVRRREARWYAALMRRGFRQGVRIGLLVGLAQAAGAFGAARGPERPSR